jgi:hypothetical protein
MGFSENSLLQGQYGIATGSNPDAFTDEPRPNNRAPWLLQSRLVPD